MKALTVQLHLRSALLIAGVGGGDPNSSVGYRYIPGSTLRGALIERYLGGKTADAGDATFRRLFLDGSVCFLNGYPLASRGARMLPTPLSWQQPKDAQKHDPAHDWAWGHPTIAVKAWKGIGGESFCAIGSDSKVERVTPEMQINIHIAREDRQRPTSGRATVFRYDALAEGQTFAAVIVAEDEADLATIHTLLPAGTMLALGRSRSAGYGWVEVGYARDQDGAAQTAVESDWQEAAVIETPAGSALAETPTAPERLIVTLLSDALIQDEATGAQRADLWPVVGVEPLESFSRLHTVGGFNRKWNLPLPQGEAIAAGSVFVYPYSAALAERLRRLADQGIGSRRVEGFGRIAVNWQAGATVEFAKAAPASVGRPPVVSASAPVAKQMVTRMLRAELDRALLRTINEHPIERRELRNAQLARLRVVARQALAPAQMEVALQGGQIARFTAFLYNLKESARNQLLRARLGDQPLFDWLMGLAKQPTEVWTIMQVNVLPMPSLGNVRAELTTPLAIEYALRLIDGLAQLATREGKHE